MKLFYPTIRDLTAALIPHLSTSFVGSLLALGVDGAVVVVMGFGDVIGGRGVLPTEPKMTGFGGTIAVV